MAAPKNPVSGRTVKKTTYNILNPLGKPKVTTTTERTPRKSAAKPTPKPTVKPTVKPKVKPTPAPKFTAPSVAEFRQSAAYKTNSMTYKEYVDTAYSVFKAKNKNR